MMRLNRKGARRRLAFSVTGLFILAGAIVGARQLYVTGPGYGLPYYARFTPEAEDRWTALGGTWEVADGSMHNDSNDRGAKLLTGSPNWKDYIVQGDVQVLGAGSAGVLARVSEAELGENSFKGYFAGIRGGDNSLVLGSYDFAYHEMVTVRMPEPVRPFRWYHVKLVVDGCRIAASAWTAGMRELDTAPLNDPDCFRSGAVGLRSNGTGGIWRNVTVLPVHSVSSAGRGSAPLLPSTDTIARQRTNTRRTGAEGRSEGASSVVPQPVFSLQYMPPYGSPHASVRGSVVLIKPALFIEDPTGGVEIQSDSAPPLKIGDEVEVTGEVSLDKFSPVIRRGKIRLLSEALPVSPMVLEANQVATGRHDGRFVQVEGYLRTIAPAKGGTLTMEIDAGTQSFHVILPPGRSRSHLQHIAPGSRLRLRGVPVVDARFNESSDPFVILARSAEDVEVVAGPPWWRLSNLIIAAFISLALIFVFNHLYLLVKHWRLRAVAEERERLAHEIHDTLAQSFAGIGFQLQAIRNCVPRDSQALEHQVERAMLMARTSHEEARRSIASLRPQSLGHAGLLPALRECAERMVRNGRVRVETHGDENSRDVPLYVKDTLFRIGQEAIANSIRHADPGTIRIRLQQQRSSLCLFVEDDGAGFIADGDHSGFGLRGMRKRAESISATLVIRSIPGSGTEVEVRAVLRSTFRIAEWHRRGISA